MSDAVILVTGFGAFLDVTENPSRAVARALADDVELQAALGARVLAGELPVVFEEIAPALDEHLRVARASGQLAAVLALGVQREASFRLERRARHVLSSEKLDNAGVAGAGLELTPPRELRTSADLEHLEAALRAAGAADVTISDDAGGYVCERTYHALLGRAEEHGLPAVFLHLPPEAELAAAEQLPYVAACLRALATQALASG